MNKVGDEGNETTKNKGKIHNRWRRKGLGPPPRRRGGGEGVVEELKIGRAHV